MLRLVALNGNSQVSPLPVAGEIVAKSSEAEVRKPVVPHTVWGKVRESVEVVVLGFMAMTLNVVELETTRVWVFASEPVRGRRCVPAGGE